MNYSKLNTILRPKTRKEIDQDVDKLPRNNRLALNAYLKIARLFENGDSYFVREAGRKIAEDLETDFDIFLFSRIHPQDNTLQISFYKKDANGIKDVLINKRIPFIDKFRR